MLSTKQLWDYLISQSHDFKEWSELDISTGLKKAQEGLGSAKRNRDSASSDFSYWSYDSAVAYYTFLAAIFERLKRGYDDFPDLPKTTDDVVMDRNGKWIRWANDLLTETRYCSGCNDDVPVKILMEIAVRNIEGWTPEERYCEVQKCLKCGKVMAYF